MRFALVEKTLPILAFTAISLVGVPASASPYSSMVVFGDSLSDNGNNSAVLGNNSGQVVTGNSYIPSAGPYATGVYSNGPVWASDVASSLGLTLAPSQLGGTDFAYGGATTGTPGGGPGGFPFSLVTQASQYLASANNQASPTALYVIAGGGNNARDALAAIAALPPGTNPGPTIAATAASYAANIKTIVNELNAAGAKHIVVWNTPNIGLAPAVEAAGAQASGLGSLIALSMNTALGLQLAGETDVSMFDIFGLGTQIALDPAAFGFTNATDACGAAPVGTDCSKYVYWDGIHPTAAGHLVIADAFLTIASPVPELGTWAMMLLGFAGVGFVVHRQKSKSTLIAT